VSPLNARLTCEFTEKELCFLSLTTIIARVWDKFESVALRMDASNIGVV